MSITYTMPEVEAKLQKWHLLNYVNQGWLGIEKNINSVIKKEDSETEKSYEYRADKLTHFNYFTPTLKGISGLVFSKPIQLIDVPTQVEALRDDFDNQGNSMDKIIGEMFFDAQLKGVAFAFLDTNSTADVKSKADEKKKGIRPYVVQVPPENVTSFKFDDKGLSQVKIREFVNEDDDKNPYKVEAVEQYRVLERGTYRVIRVVEDKEVLIDEGFTNLPEIMFFCLNLMETSRFLADFPFYDLAKQNIRLTQMFTDVSHSIHLANVPMLKFIGFEADELKKFSVGANKAITTTNAEASVDFLTLDTNAIANSKILTDEIKMEMLKASLSVLSESDTSNNVTAKEAGIDATIKQSKLTRWVNALEGTFAQILDGMAQFYNTNGGNIHIDSDVAQNPLDAQELTAYTNMVNNGQLSNETFFQLLQERKNINNDIDFEDEQTKIQTDGLLLPKDSE